MLHLIRPVTSLCDNAVKKALWSVSAACLLFLGILALPAALAHGQSTTGVYILPKYQILGVVYAPPGSASNVTYAQSDLVGTSNTIGSSLEQNYGVAVTVGFDFDSFLGGHWGFGDTVSTGWTATSGGSSTVSVQTQTNNAVSTPGPVSSALGVNHDNDVIYIMLNPVMATQANGSNALSLTAVQSNSCDVTDLKFAGNPYQAVAGCDPNQYPFPDIVAIPVWCLKNPYFPSQSCAQWLPYTSRSWDTANWGTDPVTNLPLGPMLTLQDYADILSADPFVTQTLEPANTVANFYCHQVPSSSNQGPPSLYSYGVNLDPNDAESITATPPTLTNLAASNLTASGCKAAGGTYSSSGGTCTWPPNFCAPPASTPASCANAGGSFVSGSCAFTNSNPIAAQRFTPFNTVQYPEPGIDGEPQTYTGSIAYTTSSGTTANSTNTSSISNTLCVQFGGSGSCPGSSGGDAGGATGSIGNSFSVTTGFTWTDTQSTTSTNSQTGTASYTIVGPQLSDNYTGPTTYNVYEDNVYGTFAFYSNLQREQPAIQLSAPAAGVNNPVWATNGLALTTTGVYISPVQVAYNATPSATNPTWGPLSPGSPLPFGSATACNPPYPPTYPVTCPVTQTGAPLLQELKLTNYSQNQMTMAGPAVTFSDPGFQVLYGQNASGQNYDTCSNQVLQSMGTCTIWAQFSPVTSDAPQEGPNQTSKSYPVVANLVAAGTENISGYQNILVTSTGILVSGTATTGSTYLGATLNCNGTAPNCGGNQYTFGSVATYTSIPPETFTFTNNSSSSMAVTQVKLSDSLDFAVQSNTCTGATIPSSETCTLALVFTPSNNSQFSTGISVLGTLDVAGASTVPQLLAGAVASGTETSPSFTTNPSSITDVETLYSVACIDGGSIISTSNSPCQQAGNVDTTWEFGGGPYTVTITNLSNNPLTFYTPASSSEVTETVGTCPQISGGFTVPSGTNNNNCTITVNIASYTVDSATTPLTNTTVGVAPNLPVTYGFDLIDCYYKYGPSNPIFCNPAGDSNDLVVSSANVGQPVVVTADSPGSALLTVTAGKSFSGKVSFSCQNLPANASCTFAPSTVNLSASGSQSTNLTVSLAATSATASRSNRPMFPISALAALLCFAGLNKRTRSRLLLLILLGVVGLASISACGGSGAGGSHGVPTSSTITVVATSGNVSTTLGVPITVTQ